MSEKDDKFVKLSFHKHMKKQEVELSREIPPLTKEEVHRIKIKAQKRLNRHEPVFSMNECHDFIRYKTMT